MARTKKAFVPTPEMLEMARLNSEYIAREFELSQRILANIEAHPEKKYYTQEEIDQLNAHGYNAFGKDGGMYFLHQ